MQERLPYELWPSRPTWMLDVVVPGEETESLVDRLWAEGAVRVELEHNGCAVHAYHEDQVLVYAMATGTLIGTYQILG